MEEEKQTICLYERVGRRFVVWPTERNVKWNPASRMNGVRHLNDDQRKTGRHSALIIGKCEHTNTEGQIATASAANTK